MEQIESKIDFFINMAMGYMPRLALALLTLIVGFWVIKRLMNIFKIVLKRRMDSPDVVPYIVSIVSVLLKVLLLVSIAGIVGIETSSFVAVLAAAGFAIGLALQGSLSNFAAGAMILIFKPFVKGDIIEIAGSKGRVTEIQIFNTIMRTPTNQNVIVPNSKAAGDKIINHSTYGHIRVDNYAHVPYAEDFEKVRDILMTEILKNPKILKDPAPSVDIESFDSHSLQIGTFVFANTDDYWDVFYSMNLLIKTTLGKNDIKIAYAEGIEMGKIGKN